MKPFHAYSVLAALVLSLAAPVAGAATRPPVLQPDKLLILSTTDVRGKTGPCGCHIPKGGLARRASFVDSLRLTYGQVLLVDNGGFFPAEDNRRAAPGFMLDVMKTLGVRPSEAISIGDETRDIDAGRKAKLATAGVSWGYTQPQALADKTPDHMLGNVPDVVALLT